MITLEDLENIRGLNSELKALEEQINGLYGTYRSPSFSGDTGSHGGGPGNPTERTVVKILSLKEIYAEKYAEISQKLLDVEQWLSGVDDPEIRSIVRNHYILNKSWQQTSTAVYGYPSYYNSRKRIYRFFGREK